MIIWAVARTARYELVFDCKLRQALVKVRWPWRRTYKTFNIAEAVQVQRHSSRPIESPDFHWVSLGIGTDGHEMKLFKDAPFGDHRADKADKIAQEIGNHLQLQPVLRYANGLKVTEQEHADSTRHIHQELMDEGASPAGR